MSRFNITNYGDLGETIRVGIVDSVHKPDGMWREQNIGGSTDFTDFDEDKVLTTPHGQYLADTIDLIVTDDIELFFYRVMDREGKTSEGDLIKAIGQAVEDDVDILNLSLGADHVSSSVKDCDKYTARCFVSEVCERAISDGISVVAGAGNQPDTMEVACPSLCDRVISVASAVVECGCPEENPPGACWIESNEVEASDNPILCSTIGCGPGLYCTDHQVVTEWGNNPNSTNNKPDILAPCHIPVYEQHREYYNEPMISGTSFSAPFVVGQIANCLAVFQSEDCGVTPEDIRCGVREGAEQGQTDMGLLNGIGTFNNIGEPFNISNESTGDHLFDGDIFEPDF